MILAIFDLQVHPILPIKFRVNWLGLVAQESKFKTDFQDGGRNSLLGFLNRTILGTSDLQVALTLPTKFRVN